MAALGVGALDPGDRLLGDQLTVADFSLGAPMVMAVPAQYPLAPYPEISRWYAGFAALPAWQQSIPQPA